MGRTAKDEILRKYYNSCNPFTPEEFRILERCTLCPRECGVNRFEEAGGYCGTDAGLNIASICIHNGEEPPISGPNGICNIFFASCNLRCVYCQNHEISRPVAASGLSTLDLKTTLDIVEGILSKGIRAVGFVSPSHVVPQVKTIIRGLGERGLKPITVYNTNSYDKPETLRGIADIIDVYLPDYKYVTADISASFSDSYDYPVIALKALKEMYWQKGSTLVTDDNGTAEKGILIRHLVLPGYAEESKKVLKSITEELSTGVHVSLMSQYHPTPYVETHPILKRTLYKAEYNSAAEAMEELGFRNGWIQDMDNFGNYRPDFKRKHPFEG